MQAINEELRSTAEKLETSREEVQAINEELTTVNQELKIRIEEMTISSNNLHNLVNATNIGTIFLDRSFRVVLFTPAAGVLFNLNRKRDTRRMVLLTHTAPPAWSHHSLLMWAVSPTSAGCGTLNTTACPTDTASQRRTGFD